MARRTTYNRTNKNTETPSLRRQRAEARANGRGRNQAFTSGARSANTRQENAQAMRAAWNLNNNGRGTRTRNVTTGRFQNEKGNVQTYTRSASGKMSVNGQTAGGNTWTFSDKDRGRQSGRSQMASRRQRYYDVRVGLGLAGG